MVTNTTIYTRQMYVSLSNDVPDVDFHNGDEVYLIDTRQRVIYDEENNTWYPILTGGGGGTLITKSIAANGTYNAADDNADGYSSVIVNVPNVFKKTTVTVASSSSFRDIVYYAHIAPIAQDELLFVVQHGENVQEQGSVGVKWIFTTVQNGAAVNNGGASKQSSSKVAPDSMQPSSNTTTSEGIPIVDGEYHLSSPLGYVGGGNTVDFIQIPYNMGWDV